MLVRATDILYNVPISRLLGWLIIGLKEEIGDHGDGQQKDNERQLSTE